MEFRKLPLSKLAPIFSNNAELIFKASYSILMLVLSRLVTIV